MAEGKKKRSLREAFGVIEAPKEATAPAPERDIPASDTSNVRGHATQRRRPESDGGSKTRSRRQQGEQAQETGDPVNTGKRAEARSGGSGRAPARKKQEEKEMVPGKGGKMVLAETPVNMTFTVTAKERYLWTLELKRRGRTAVSVLREMMEGMVGEGDR